MCRLSSTVCLFASLVVVARTATMAQGADDVQTLKEQNASLQNRVGQLETQLKATQGELMEIRKLLEQLSSTQQKRSQAPQSPALTPVEVQRLKSLAQQDLGMPPAAVFTQPEVARLREIAATSKTPVVSSLAVDLYGFVRVDASYDSARTTGSNYALWVDNEQMNSNDDQFGITARHSRVGLNIKGPKFGQGAFEAETSGKIEVDFDDTNSNSNNKPSPVMRHAYLVIKWPKQRFSILAGQTWDVISPLYAPTLSYSVMWWQGNIGYRRPQVRLTKEFVLAENEGKPSVLWKWEVAAARTIGRRTSFTRGGARPGDTGEDAGSPSVQARTGITFPGIGGRKTTVGVSGHYGQEEFDRSASGNPRHLTSWSLNADVVVPVADWLKFKGEGFYGQNLAAYLGGIGQGVNTTTLTEITSHGGWVAASFGPFNNWSFNAGAGYDDPDTHDLTSSTSRTYNQRIFGNTWYTINKKTKVGFEVSHLKTNYDGLEAGNSVRAQLAFLYTF